MKGVLTLFLNLFLVSAIAQQRPMLTQYMFNSLTVNPAYSAIGNDLNVAAIYRQQWVGFEGAPNTQFLTMHSAINQSNSSLGLVVMRDHIGEVINETGAFLTFAQRMKLSETTYLAVGVLAGTSRYAANYSQLWDQVSSSDPIFQNESIGSTNLGFGIMLFSNRFYAGLSSPFMLSLTNDPTQINHDKPHYMAQGGYLVPLGDDFMLKHNILLKYVNGAPLEADISEGLLIHEAIWLGVAWRSFDSFDGILQMYISRNLQVGYSYDFTTTKIGPVQKGSHELMLRLTFPHNGSTSRRCYFF